MTRTIERLAIMNSIGTVTSVTDAHAKVAAPKKGFMAIDKRPKKKCISFQVSQLLFAGY